jgi:DNA-binding CsgD family transcriptional regulator
MNGPRLFNNTALLQQLDGWSRSVFYNDMLRGNKGENSVDFQLRDSSGIRGAFAISRGLQDRPMVAEEMRRVAALAPHFIRAMNSDATINEHETIASPEMAHIIANRTGEIISYSADSANRILQLYNIPLGHGVRFSDVLNRLPPAAMVVVERLQMIQSDQGAQPASLEVPTRWGLFRVSAVPMQASPDILSETVIVTIQPLITKRVKHAAKLLDTDLTAAERRVALRMAGTGDGDAIARDLGIKTSSYRQYAKRIYTTLGVDGRMGVKQFLDSGGGLGG